MAAVDVNINSVPDNILLEIISYLSVKDRCVCGRCCAFDVLEACQVHSGGVLSRVCRRWRKVTQDFTLWRHVDLLPYNLDLCKMWKFLRSHLSDCLKTLKVRGNVSRKNNWDQSPLSEALLKELKNRCPSLLYLHLELSNITKLPSARILPSSLTHLVLHRNIWPPRWFQGSVASLTHLVHLDLAETTRVDNHDVRDIVQFTNLLSLKLDGCYRLTEEGLLLIPKHLRSLTSLSLMHCNTTDLLAHHIARNLKELRELNLSFSKSLTESCLPIVIDGLLNLEQLFLDGCSNMSLKAFSVLSNSGTLKSLSIKLEESFSEEEIQPWKKKMERCYIQI
ncbi:F-box/LRR-repeat protein 12-like isoform X3 [Pomacea canaliculata]|uniref:F-box/LRR-repeat protein 12-like isoform X3 n=1 Tax=Pomacea canaliculata TaxID=400727 RepID=UPI000D73C318|nr:F-box/LRR-repeat protein 12-like isoform X3 [Pomacea canaliculata]